VPALLGVEWLVIGYLTYMTAVAWLGGRPTRARLVLTSAAAADAAFILGLAAIDAPAAAIAREWLPALQVFICYRLSGLLFVRPMAGLERWLVRSDEAIGRLIGARRLFDRMPAALVELVELAYLSVSPMLPAGFAVVVALASPHDADRFWTVVLAAEVGCYGMLPWLQTRPPFATMPMDAIEARRIHCRALTRALMGRVSIHVNTLPSGHAAGSLATALAVWDQAPAAGPWFLLWSALVIVGSVAGRYHYAVDAIAGVLVAVAAYAVRVCCVG
jgi:membrane-associated phospholipid phosphatase